MKKVAIIGAGLQAKRRVPVIADDQGYEVAAIIDVIPERAQMLASQYGGTVGTDWRTVVTDPSIDVIMVLTPPDSHADISMTAMKNGKDVFCEKPLSRTVEEARAMVETAETTGRILKCGFNHRHHPAVEEAYRLFQQGVIGKPVFGRGRYGIAGREGVEKEWRSNPSIVSGGQLMEQGIHLVDLFRWFLGDMVEVTGMVGTTHWPIAPLEDNGFGLFKNANGVISSVHASLTQWINLFEFELYGDKGSLTVQALGASYGVEKLLVNTHNPHGPFEYRTIEYRRGDVSWKGEWEAFAQAVATRTQPIGNGKDGLRSMEIVNAVYTASQHGQSIQLTS